MYDRYVVKWRVKYDTETIIPRICEPFRGKLDNRFAGVARENRKEFMRELFYEFARDREPRIPQNALTRFYERITNYWALQLAEIFLYLLAFVSLLYLPVYRWLEIPWRNLIIFILIVVGVLGLNSWLGGICRVQVAEATDEEIREIHKCCSQDLDNRLAKLSSKFGLKYE
jgi:hypothetical protein